MVVHCLKLLLLGLLKFVILIDAVNVTLLKEDVKFEDMDFVSNISRGESRRWGTDAIISALGLNDVACFAAKFIDTAVSMIFSIQESGKENPFITFYARGRQSIEVDIIDKNVKISPFFNPNDLTVIIIHGFLTTGKTKWVMKMKDAFLHWDQINVLVLDWSAGASSWYYGKAVRVTQTIGSDVGKYLKELMKKTGADPKKFYCVGHSLGAHLCAFTSHEVNKLGRITALDPAYPCFNVDDLSQRLHPGSADYVDVIHTNAHENILKGLGHPDKLGVADFYPNGGFRQPNCHKLNKLADKKRERLKNMDFDDIFESLKHTCAESGICALRGVGDISKLFSVWPGLSSIVCNHRLAIDYFIESLFQAKTKCTFKGIEWKRPDSVLGVVTLNTAPKCNDCPEMGINANGEKETKDGSKVKARGSFYVRTKPDLPYCYFFTQPQKNLSNAASTRKLGQHHTIGFGLIIFYSSLIIDSFVIMK